MVHGWILLKSTEHMDPRQQLPFAKQSLKGWKSRYPGKTRTGVDLCLWDLVGLECARSGALMTAMAVLVQGDAYLRPSEVFAITKQHLIPPRAARTKNTWGVIIGLLESGKPTKAKDYDDVVLFDTPSRSDVNIVVSKLGKRRIQETDCIFSPLTYSQYLKDLQAAIASLKLEFLGLSPHSLRHSGASHDSYHGVRDAKSIQTRGRWKAAESVRRYKRPGRMLLTQKDVSKATWNAATRARPQLISMIQKQHKL